MRQQFPAKLYPGRIILRCSASTAPGLEWNAFLAFVPKGDKTEVWARLLDEDSRGVELVETLDVGLDWRSYADFLVHSDECALAGDFLGEAKISGARGYVAEILLLAWMHDENSLLHKTSEALFPLSDEFLARLYQAEGPFGDATFAERIANLQELAEAAGVGNEPLDSLMKRASTESLSEVATFLEQLVEEREKSRTDERVGRLASLQDTIYRWASEAAGPRRANEPSFAWEFRRSKIQRYLENYVVEYQRLPTGKYDFGWVQTGYRSHSTIGIVDFDELAGSKPSRDDS